MHTTRPVSLQPVSLPEDAAKLARASGLVLQRLMAGDPTPQDAKPPKDAGPAETRAGDAVRLRVERPDGSRADLDVPPAALALLASLLEEMGRGAWVTVLSTRDELTTQQAADLLRVSRPYLVKLLTDRQIPYRTVGSRRRIRLEDVLRYRERSDAARHKGLDELVAEAQALRMY